MKMPMTLISEKFTYSPIERKQIDGKRKYLTPDGKAVASVTTILDATKDKTHLINWRKRVGEAKAQEITTEAAGVGTRMHKYLEDYIDTGDWPNPGSNPYAQQAHKMAGEIKNKALKDVNQIWGSEVKETVLDFVLNALAIMVSLGIKCEVPLSYGKICVL